MSDDDTQHYEDSTKARIRTALSTLHLEHPHEQFAVILLGEFARNFGCEVNTAETVPDPVGQKQVVVYTGTDKPLLVTGVGTSSEEAKRQAAWLTLDILKRKSHENCRWSDTCYVALEIEDTYGRKWTNKQD